MAKVKADLTELNNLMKMLKKDYRVRVGILGSKAAQQHDSKSGKTNVEIGTFHEFGTSKMPQRSFLRMPLETKLSEEIPNLKKTIFKQIFIKNAPDKFFKDLGNKALDIIEDAFNTEGFGYWTRLKRSTREAFSRKAAGAGWRNGSITKFRKGLNAQLDHQILTDTRRLRRSISMKVIKK